jgi:hypothetical protein
VNHDPGSKRESILAKVRALLAKTVENGCTEAEAMAALDRAYTMIASHELTDEELKAIKDEKAEVYDTGRSDARGIYMFLARAVAEFCGVKTFKEANGPRGPWRIMFCGLPSDVQFADWLLETLAVFVRTELRNYLIDVRPRSKARIRVMNGFVIGCTGRISERLNTLSMAREKETPKGNGRELVLAKADAIQAAMKDIKLGKARASTRTTSRVAHQAGWDRGAEARFDRPVEHGGPQMIADR